ncbi:exocyst complex component 2-like isoform X2 [Lineus longissimus]|uniref:exocyst complex component 2-like isoform X2 n=1 Tax=Lineus longissimus TaxID=88925 RepID=UPI00315DCAC9
MPIPKKDPPLVNGISPKEGPPGTRVTIRGENLGFEPKDLIGLRICGVDCLLSAEWKTSSKIVARTGPGKGTGDVIVVTMSGGIGTCLVGFRGYFVQTGPLQESAVWIDESATVHPSLNKNRPSSPILKTQEDPLGISDEGNQGKYGEEDLLDLFPEGSGNVTLENFDPAWFLLENHHATRFQNLKDGLAFLRLKSAERSEGPLSFVKANLTTFLECQESLEGMHQKLLEDETSQKGASLTDQLDRVLQESDNCANALFMDVLGRKDRADATRNALSVLSRFKFLFNLPCNIERNIKKGDYDLVINDYARAKSLFGSTEVQVFRKVYTEVEQRISAFRGTLHKKLLQLPSTLDEQKKLIRYLVNLELQGDPAWECLVNQQKWLITLMSNCKDEHLAAVAESASHDGQLNSDNEIYRSEYHNSPSVSVSPPPGSYHTLPKSVMRRIGITRTSESDSDTNGATNQTNAQSVKHPQKVQFVEELTAILTDSLPDLWRLGQAYFAGQLFIKESGEKAMTINTSKHAQFKTMISEVINLFSNLLRAAFLPDTLESLERKERKNYGHWPDPRIDIPGAWLPHCVRYVRSCVMSLATVDVMGDCVELLQELAFDMRTHCMSTLLKQAVDDIHNLHTRETWVVEVSDEYGGTTQLPILFENVINETIQHLHEVVMKIKQGETEIFSLRLVQKEANSLVIQLLQAFQLCLEDLAFHGIAAPKHSKRKGKSSPGGVKDAKGDSIPPLDRRLIIMLSNTNNTIERVIPRLIENFEKHGYPETNKALSSAQLAYQKLDDKLFDAYVEEKANPIIGVLEPNMYAGKFDWKNCSKPTGVRNYIKEALMGLIAVHAEVVSISPAFVTRVMHKVIESVADELARLFQCVTAFSNYGAVQARLELYSLQDAVDIYITDKSRSSFQDALECVQEVTIADDRKLLEELLNSYKAKMRFHLLSLRIEPKEGASEA